MTTTRTQASGLLSSLARDSSLAHSTRKLTISWSHTPSLDNFAPVTSDQAHTLFSMLPNLRELTLRHTDGLRALIERTPRELHALLGQLTTLRIVGPSACRWQDLVKIFTAAPGLRVVVVARLTDAVEPEEGEQQAQQDQPPAQAPTQALAPRPAPFDLIDLTQDTDDEDDELEIVERAATPEPMPFDEPAADPAPIASTSVVALEHMDDDDDDDEPDEAVAPELPSVLSIRSLTLSAPTIEDETLINLLRATRGSIRSFHLLGADTITRAGLLGALQHLGPLEELELHACDFSWGSDNPPFGHHNQAAPPRRPIRPAAPPAAGAAPGAGGATNAPGGAAFNWIGRAVPPPVASPVLPPLAPAGGPGWPQFAQQWLQHQAGAGAGGPLFPPAFAALLMGAPPTGAPAFANAQLQQLAALNNPNPIAANFLPPLAPPPQTFPISPYEHQLAYPLDHLPQWCPFLHWLSATSDDIGSLSVLRELAKLPLVTLAIGFTAPRLDAVQVRDDLLDRVPVDGGRLESLVVHGRMRWREDTRRAVKDLCARRGTLFQWEGEDGAEDEHDMGW